MTETQRLRLLLSVLCWQTIVLGLFFIILVRFTGIPLATLRMQSWTMLWLCCLFVITIAPGLPMVSVLYLTSLSFGKDDGGGGDRDPPLMPLPSDEPVSFSRKRPPCVRARGSLVRLRVRTPALR